ncbi:MAG TPA: cytochrome c biogenesis protein CcsA [Syntrophales bacterium]|nr:cytochrome c biogenesis protein CcsA [Syntrophales bacterium]HOD98909.1 cytochrome c biogenesis protein CcsA [Syntrophales bacterium]HPX81652.1 cytochrome c biogenesis protein CcsA [Syntrophales bacterium]HQB14375.1 cytochrome c biogenesis protein CcsA [Syntrophales bacterium]HQK79592.1 cytochrome c biogenesis protein CcsA [Syntrophales bacterium]
MDLYLLLYRLVLVAYLISTLAYMFSLLSRRVTPAKAATWIMAGACGLHALFFLGQWATRGYNPFLRLHDSLSFFALVMAGVYLAFQFRTKTRVLGVFVSPAVFLLMIVSSVGIGGPLTAPETLQGGLVSLHAMLSVIGEALFALASAAGLAYLIQDGLLKRRKASRLMKLFPPLRDLDRINHICLLWGFPLLTLGMVAGSIWARTVWGSHWQWDPKQIWTLAAWLIYAILLHQRLAIGWKGHKSALLSVVAFVVLLAAFLVEKYFFTTIHQFY